MAPIPSTPRRSGAGRPRKSVGRPRGSGNSSSRLNTSATPQANTEPPPKKRRYIPGGPGGGGRYVDEDGTEIPVGGTGPGGYNYVGPRGRVGRENAEKGITPVVYPRRDRSTRTRSLFARSEESPRSFTSAAQMAAAVVQNDGYKPREERGWEEFHPDLDIDIDLQMFSADEVDGTAKSRPATPAGANGVNGQQTPNGDVTKSNGETTPSGSLTGGTLSLPGTPSTKRRPGRPPRDPVAFYAAREAAAAGTPRTSRIMPLQHQHAKERLTLPQPSYRKVDALAKFEDKASGQAKYVDKSMANVGYQETDIFIRPERVYLKSTDGLLDEDLDLAMGTKSGDGSAIASGSGVGLVEYDMDEQDDKWLEAFNEERRAAGIEAITREIFEITMTKIEKEWHALEKRIPKPNPKPPQTHRPRSSSAAAVNGEPQFGEEQDSKCAICDDGDCENTNAIVFCDGCDLAVHQDCYGIPFIPEGQWLCRRCQLAGRGVPTCIFCPNTEGAFKQTNSSRWAHLLCALWIPEVSLGNQTFLEPVMDVEKVPKTRWKLRCYICKQKMGACIQCGNKACYEAFHVTCARRAHLYLKMKVSPVHQTEADLQEMMAFCDKHCPTDYARDNDVERATWEARRYYKKAMKGRLWADTQEKAQELAAKYQHAITEHPPDESQRMTLTLGDNKKKGSDPTAPVWKLPSGAPIIPAAVYDIVENALARFMIRKRRDFVAAMCRYWTLKREARRGAPLIKRLQLQMDSFTSMEITRRDFAAMGHVGRTRLDRRIEFTETLIKDLERLKYMMTGVVERETLKLQLAEVEVEGIRLMYFPIAKLLPSTIDKALSSDSKRVFATGLMDIQHKLEHGQYALATLLVRDFTSVLSQGIAHRPVTSEDVESEEPPPNSKLAINEMKERKKLAKRIIKAVQPQLEYAIRAEADVTCRSPELMVQDLEALLESCLEGNVDSGQTDAAGRDDADAILADGEQVEEGGDAMDVDVHDEDAPGEEDVDMFAAPRAVAEDHSTAEPQSKTRTRSGFSNSIKSDTPPDTNGYVEPLEHPHDTPPTPPISSGGANSTNGHDAGPTEPGAFLTEGGTPWYLKEFDPVGLSVLDRDKQWAGSGRDAIRGLSEPLSEIDDDALKGLAASADMEEVDEEMEEAAEAKGAAKATPKTKKGKNKKRWRGYR